MPGGGFMDEIQTLLGLPTLDKTKTRQLVRAYFELYRQYKWLLSMDVEPHREEPKARPGYENAMDPRFIHGNRVHPDGPSGPLEDMESTADQLRIQFCNRVQQRVRRLKDYQRDIIEHHYMYRYDESQPTDDETYMALYRQGWYVGKRYYEQQKAKAIMLMAAAFRIEQYRERLHSQI